jgi:penicillin-binding protein 2
MSSKTHKDESQNFEARVYVMLYVVVAIFVALGIRFWVLQVARHDVYVREAENNRIREIPELAPRGAILDRNGVVLVDNTPAYNVVVTPELITDRQATVNALVDNIGVDRARLESDLSDPQRPPSQPITVKQNATDADTQWVAAHEYEHPEIQIVDQPQRVYKFGKLACHVLGYIGEISRRQLDDPRYHEYRPGDIIGSDGIERVYDQVLRGKDGKRVVVVDSRGRPQRDIEERRVKAIKGQDIETTLDFDIQRIAEEQFDNAGQTGVAIVLDPGTGEILALVSRPAFDPSVFARNVISSEGRSEVRAILDDPGKPLFNKATRGIYPTGSTWKLLIAAAALEENVIAKESRFVCGGGIQMGNRFVNCMGSHGAPDIHSGIVFSCDGFFYRLGLKMGIDMISEWVGRFGMGSKTGIDLPHEERGIVPDRRRKKAWKDIDTVWASIGQGLAITPLQLIRGTAGIMMNGELHSPHVLKEAKATSIAEVKYFDDKRETVSLRPETAKILRYAAWGVVNEGGTGGGAAIPHLNIGGKTGTAQVIAKEKAKTKEHQDHAWFVSFAPVQADVRPEIAVVVLTEHGGQGGRASAPKARAILAAYFSKKLGRPILPELFAKSEDSTGGTPATPAKPGSN